MIYEKLKLRTGQCFVDSLTGILKELEKVFLPARFLPTQASTFQFCFGSVYTSKVKAKLKRAYPHRTEEKITKIRNMIIFAAEIQRQGINAVLKVKILMKGQKALHCGAFWF